MQLDQPRPTLEPPDAARVLLSGCPLRDPERGWRNLAGVAAALPPDGLRDLDRPLEEITRDISRTADVALEVALAVALRQVGRRYGRPCTPAGRPVSCVVLAFGKHGGEELNYSSDIDLMFVYEEEGATRGKRI